MFEDGLCLIVITPDFQKNEKSSPAFEAPAFSANSKDQPSELVTPKITDIPSPVAWL